MAIEHRAPLAPRWLAAELPAARAGERTTAAVRIENAGVATWRSRGAEGLQLAYHWLDPLGNAIVWDGIRTPLPHPLAPGETLALDVPVLAPRPPGRYLLRFDLVEEHRFWLADVGCATLDLPVDVRPRIDERRLAVLVHGGVDPATAAALERQEEALVEVEPAAVAHLVAGAIPPPDWSRRMLDAHAEGWAAVGPALAPGGGWLARRRDSRRLAAWRAGGRNPRPAAPLLLPSLLAGLEPGEHLGLPAYDGPEALLEGRVVVRLPQRFGRPRP
jgi:hypothetical protein